MPSRMEEIRARSAQSGDEYRARKAANDEAASTFRAVKKKEVEKRTSRVKMTTAEEPGSLLGATGESRKRYTAVAPVVVLAPKVLPVVVDEVPVDIADYSVVPAEMDAPVSIIPATGTLYGIPPVVGTMMVMLGKRMLVSMAVTGLEFAAMEPLQQYGKGLPRAKVLWQTGRSPGELQRSGMRLRADYERGWSGTGYVDDDPLAKLKEALRIGGQTSEWVSEQIRTWFGFGGWLG